MGTLPELAEDYVGSPGCLPAPARLWSGDQEGCVLCRAWLLPVGPLRSAAALPLTAKGQL